MPGGAISVALNFVFGVNGRSNGSRMRKRNWILAGPAQIPIPMTSIVELIFTPYGTRSIQAPAGAHGRRPDT